MMLHNDVLDIVSSSSAGNCYIYNQDLMLDIGVSFAKVKKYIQQVSLILLTHVHGDHFNPKTLKRVIYENPQIKIICGFWFVDRLRQIGIPLQNIYVLEMDHTYIVGKYIIEPVMAMHDVPNFGYKIRIKENGYKIFHISDTSDIEHITAKDYDWYSIEANYETDDELEQRIREDEENGVYSHYKRVKETHLSQLKAINWLDKNKGENSSYVFIHQHVPREEENGQ